VTDRLFRLTTSLLERRVSRRSVLVRFATAGSAMMIAPLRYLLRPGSAIAAIGCRDCPSGSLCCDGWTAFCCTLTGVNACPSNTYIAGWWKCTQYRGNGPCAAEGVRYYIDCNSLPGKSCPGGCHCANDRCSHRSTCCNIFRYGQCNTQIPGVTPIACRVIKCVNPCTIYQDCSCTHKQEDITCRHEEAGICL
jgi:hypothetical protein